MQYDPIDNKYYRWYNSICQDRQIKRGLYSFRSTKKPKNYTAHHIIPECFFKKYGVDGILNGYPHDKNNIVMLTDEEHFLVHWLLTKFYTGKAKQKMCLAFNLMCNGNKTSKYYDIARRNLKKSFENGNHPRKGKEPWSKGKKNIFSPEELQRRSDKMSGENNPMYGRSGELNPNYGNKGPLSPIYNKGNINSRKRKWKLISPFGEIFYFDGLPQKFCRENNLDATNLWSVAQGRHKTHRGWKAEILGNII